MITFDAFLVFLLAASLPVTYLRLMSRWIEADYRKTNPAPATGNRSATQGRLVQKPA